MLFLVFLNLDRYCSQSPNVGMYRLQVLHCRLPYSRSRKLFFFIVSWWWPTSFSLTKRYISIMPANLSVSCDAYTSEVANIDTQYNFSSVPRVRQHTPHLNLVFWGVIHKNIKSLSLSPFFFRIKVYSGHQNVFFLLICGLQGLIFSLVGLIIILVFCWKIFGENCIWL